MVVVVRGGHLVDDDVVLVEGSLARVLQVVVLQLGPQQPRRRLDRVPRGRRAVLAVLRLVVEPQRALVIPATDETLS